MDPTFWEAPPSLHTGIVSLLGSPLLRQALNITPSVTIVVDHDMLGGTFHRIIPVTISDVDSKQEYILRVPVKPSAIIQTHRPLQQSMRDEVGLMIWLEKNVNLGQGVKTPKIIGYDCTEENVLGMPWTLMERIEGVSLDNVWWEDMDLEQREMVVDQVVRIMWQMEQVELPREVARKIGYVRVTGVPEKSCGEGLDNIRLVSEGFDYWLGNGSGTWGDLEGPICEKMPPTSMDDVWLEEDSKERKKSAYLSRKKPNFRKIQNWFGVGPLGAHGNHESHGPPKVNSPLFRHIEKRAKGWIQACKLLPANVQEQCGTHLFSSLLEVLYNMASIPEYFSPTSSEKCVLHHYDLFPRNIMIEPSTLKITGIIDWDFAIALPLVFGRYPPSWLWTFQHFGETELEGKYTDEPFTVDEVWLKGYFDKVSFSGSDGDEMYKDYYGSGYWVRWLWQLVIYWELCSATGERIRCFLDEWKRFQAYNTLSSSGTIISGDDGENDGKVEDTTVINMGAERRWRDQWWRRLFFVRFGEGRDAHAKKSL